MTDDTTVTPTPPATGVEVVAYRDEYRADFARLNLEWIERHFAVEEADLEVFADPVEKIIAPGGQIFFVLEAGAARGTCAVLRQSADEYELAKMAVTPESRGRGFGDLLVHAAINFARAAGAGELVLQSNTKLGPALRLYEKHGFRRVPVAPDGRYRRVDVQMCFDLHQAR